MILSIVTPPSKSADVPDTAPPKVAPELKVAAPASDISSVSAVIPEPPSSPLNNISLSCTLDSITKSDDEFTKSPIAVPSSLNVTLPPFASKIISPSTSTV